MTWHLIWRSLISDKEYKFCIYATINIRELMISSMIFSESQLLLNKPLIGNNEYKLYIYTIINIMTCMFYKLLEIFHMNYSKTF